MGCEVLGLGFEVWSLEFEVLGLGFRVCGVGALLKVPAAFEFEVRAFFTDFGRSQTPKALQNYRGNVANRLHFGAIWVLERLRPILKAPAAMKPAQTLVFLRVWEAWVVQTLAF